MERSILLLAVLEGGAEGEAVGIAEVYARHLAGFEADIAPRRAVTLAQAKVARRERAVLELHVAKSLLRKVTVVEDGIGILILQFLVLVVDAFEHRHLLFSFHISIFFGQR